MAMCARKDLEKKLKERREAFRREMGEPFFDELGSRLKAKMVEVKKTEYHRQRYQRLAREANRNLVITR